jgi:long-chain acyl-CoA synthetase
MVALEDRFQTRIDEARFAQAHSMIELKQLVEQEVSPEDIEQPGDFPTWNRTWPVRLIRRLSQATWILPLARLFAHLRVEGLDHLSGLDGPVIFASNHQSHMDVPVILAALPGRWRARMAPAMLKEFFAPHFHPVGHTWRRQFTSSLNYYLACFFFNTFPIPQREAVARHTLRYMGDLAGDGWSPMMCGSAS